MNKSILISLFILASYSAKSQSCIGTIINDNFDNSALWSTTGSNNISSPGTIQITNNHVEYRNFKATQTYHLFRAIGCTLSVNDRWTAEFDFSLLTPMSRDIGAVLFALTEDSTHWQSDVIGGGNSQQNSNDAVYFTLSDPIGTNNNGNVYLQSKKDNVRGQSSSRIQISPNINYYVKIERTHTDTATLSLYTDSLRITHLAGSPVKISIDPLIGDLKYIQIGTATSGSSSRILNSNVDNMTLSLNSIVGLPHNNVQSQKTLFNITPNPSKGTPVINYKGDSNEQDNISIYNNIGSLVTTIVKKPGLNTQELDLTNFENGIYFVKYKTQVERIIIAR